MSTQGGRLPETLTQWLNSWLLNGPLGGRLPKNFRLELLAGDGSNRSFYRLHFENSGPDKTNKSFIVLSDPTWTLSKDYPPHQLFLQQHGIPVPAFFGHDSQVGCLVMDDLGDELLQMRILAQPEKKEFWLKGAIVLLAKLHGKTFPVPSELPVHSRRFDRQKYRDELFFTSEHLRQKLLGMDAYTPGETAALEDFCGRLEKIGIDVFAHRDYHTRNLLVKNDELWMIDFQDARMGPIHYDIASLLYDAYVPTTPTERETLLAAYREEVGKYPLAKQLDWTKFESELACVAFQRVVKAAGSFASFFTRWGKKTHLPYLLPALRSALDLQTRTPELGGVLKGVFPIENWIARVQDWESQQA